jgi:hypothetical protein
MTKYVTFDIHGSKAEVIEDDFCFCLTKPASGGSTTFPRDLMYAVWQKPNTPDGHEEMLGEFPRESLARLFYEALLLP